MNNVYGYINADVQNTQTIDLDFSELKVGIKKLKVWYAYTTASAPSISRGIPEGYENVIGLYPNTSPSTTYEFPVINGKSPCEFYLSFGTPSKSIPIIVFYIIEEFGGEPDKDYVKLNFNGTYKE